MSGKPLPASATPSRLADRSVRGRGRQGAEGGEGPRERGREADLILPHILSASHTSLRLGGFVEKLLRRRPGTSGRESCSLVARRSASGSGQLRLLTSDLSLLLRLVFPMSCYGRGRSVAATLFSSLIVRGRASFGVLV